MDVGGTRTTYVLADETSILARTESGTIKRIRATEELAMENFKDAMRTLQAQSGVSLREVRCTCAGVAGLSIPLVADWLRSTLHQHVGGEQLLLVDVEIALDAAFPGESGILILAGTGSNVAGRTRDGQVTTAGGYGPVLSDQGSGHRIGSQALRACFLARDEGRPNILFDAILQHWNLLVPDDLVSYANTCPTTEISTLTPVVLHCAERGDSVALEVLEREAADLAYLALLIHRRLTKSNGTMWHPRVAFAGSIMRHVHPLRKALLRILHQQIPMLSATETIIDPVLGALWGARNHVHSSRCN